MASTVTHAYFIIDVYNKLDINTKILLKDQKEKLKLFAQSMDTLNFYTSANIKKAKQVRAFAEIFHTKKTNEFIITLINYIKLNYYSNNSEVIAFLYGFISHYILDSTIHPYIYYKTGESATWLSQPWTG
ncbi:MAG: zinc dependent phospholipase C family protein, partial [Eubacteriales bacterium]|nr:zinc dependent phospholipase C family protein [Eubacteriales bacterium]